MDNEERWRAVCERAAIEQDPATLRYLVAEINRLLDERDEHLKNKEGRAA
jgi:hypothetical protein